MVGADRRAVRAVGTFYCYLFSAEGAVSIRAWDNVQDRNKNHGKR
jgi:hypothetical protein